jgi:hypothetical protein
MNVLRHFVLALLMLISVPQAQSRSSELSSPPTVPAALPVSATALESPAFNRDPALASPAGTSLGVAAPTLMVAELVDPRPEKSPVVPTRSQDVWLMLLVSALLIAHQLRRKQRSLNQRLTR